MSIGSITCTQLYTVFISVTTTDRVSAALSMIQQEENRFRLVMVNMDMPDMDRLSFLRASHQRNIQVISKDALTNFIFLFRLIVLD